MVVATHSSRDCASRESDEAQPTNHGDGHGDGPAAAAGERDEPNANVLDPGVYVGRYRILDVVGTGGIGVVYAAFDEALGRNVALKLLRPNARQPSKLERRRARLIREAQALARLSHPNVVPIYEVGMFEDRVFLAMEYIEGSTMRRWLRRSERSWSEILDKYIQAGRGLAAAHAADIVHRDFKPDNVLVGDDGRVRVLDFGLATPVPDALATGRYSTVAIDDAPMQPMHQTGGYRALTQLPPRTRGTESTPPARLSESVASLITAHGKIMGTPAYMAPEQGRGEPIDARADQYSFCVSLWEALFGERPHGPPTATARIRLHRRLGERNLTGKDVPPDIQRALERGLSLHPADRFPDMDSLLAELARKPVGYRRWLFAAAIPLVAGMGLAIGALASSGPDECVRDEDALAGVWDERVRERIGTRLTATDRAYADATWDTIAGELDRWSARWLDARVDACTDTQVHEQSAVLFDMRMACLDRQLNAVGVLTDSLAGSGDDFAAGAIPRDEADGQLEAALASVLDLPDPDRCERSALVGSALLHEDPQFDERLEDHRVVLARARGLLSLQSTAKLDEALNLVDEVISGVLGLAPARAGSGSSERSRDQALVAEAKLLRGQILAAAGKPDEAGHELRRAVFNAQASGHDAVTVEACAALVDLSHVGTRVVDDAADWADLGRATLARIGGDPHLEATLGLANARLASSHGDFEAALDEQDRVLELREQLYGPEHVELAKVLVERVQTKIQLGRYEAAELDVERALELLTAEFGLTHPEVGVAHGHAATLARARGDQDAALSKLLDALLIFEIASSLLTSRSRRSTSRSGSLSWRSRRCCGRASGPSNFTRPAGPGPEPTTPRWSRSCSTPPTSSTCSRATMRSARRSTRLSASASSSTRPIPIGPSSRSHVETSRSTPAISRLRSPSTNARTSCCSQAPIAMIVASGSRSGWSPACSTAGASSRARSPISCTRSRCEKPCSRPTTPDSRCTSPGSVEVSSISIAVSKPAHISSVRSSWPPMSPVCARWPTWRSPS
jgi:serine/threonine protein kinase/tetratricopeptide (TPR) repeat protein